MAQLYGKKTSDGNPKALECDDNGALRHLAEIKAAIEALSACISAGKVQVDTEINAVMDPTGIASEVTLGGMDEKLTILLAKQEEQTALLESILEQLDAIA